MITLAILTCFIASIRSAGDGYVMLRNAPASSNTVLFECPQGDFISAISFSNTASALTNPAVQCHFGSNQYGTLSGAVLPFPPINENDNVTPGTNEVFYCYNSAAFQSFFVGEAFTGTNTGTCGVFTGASGFTITGVKLVMDPSSKSVLDIGFKLANLSQPILSKNLPVNGLASIDPNNMPYPLKDADLEILNQYLAFQDFSIVAETVNVWNARFKAPLTDFEIQYYRSLIKLDPSFSDTLMKQLTSDQYVQIKF